MREICNNIEISIHALRGEGDATTRTILIIKIMISIHALRGEGDYCRLVECLVGLLFQSTPSVGRATFLDMI